MLRDFQLAMLASKVSGAGCVLPRAAFFTHRPVDEGKALALNFRVTRRKQLNHSPHAFILFAVYNRFTQAPYTTISARCGPISSQQTKQVVAVALWLCCGDPSNTAATNAVQRE
jgi:hypothetical protein